MRSPGESLKHEREAGGKTLEEMVEATGIRLDFLAALEQDAFDALPGRAFGKLYIRAYAEVLGFDARPVIDAYDRALNAKPVAPATSAPRVPGPMEAALARWRRDRMAAGPVGDEAEEVDEVEEAEVEPPTVPEAPAPPAPDSLFETGTWAPREPEGVQPEPEPEVVPEEPGPETWDEQRPLEQLVEEEPAVPLPGKPPPVPARAAGTKGRWRFAALLLLVLLPLMAYLIFFRSESEPPPIAVASKPEPAPAKPLPPPPPPPAAEPTPAPERTEPSHLTVTESGVGQRLVGARLEGEGDRFRTGQRVTFSTRVLGGRPGERVRHVWMRDGRVEQSIRLSLGGATWRTHSTKTLGRPGAWAVEARDEEGRVLARTEFTCAP